MGAIARRLAAALSLCWASFTAVAAAPSAGLPAEVEAALKRAKLPPAAMAAVVQEVGSERSFVSWNEQAAMNPASVFKLVTTYAALDLLGPAWSWSTPVYVNGTLRDGVLEGSVAIRGRGDPTLVLERVWLLLRRLQQAGVREIRGDILLDHSAFAPSARAPSDFDNEPYKPQNVQPDALLMNFGSVIYTFVPDPTLGIARVSAEPVLAGVQVDPIVPLSATPCEDWRATLKPRLDEPTKVRFTGGFPLACGERSWPLASSDAAAYDARLVEQLWREAGGRLAGRVRDGAVPPDARLVFEQASRPLAEVVRDINKFSNNVMAEQLFLSLAAAAAPAPAAPASVPASGAIGPSTLAGPAPVRPEEARELLRRWVAQRFGEAAAQSTVIDNGSGLSREVRISARVLGQLLQSAWISGVMPELMSSLPISGTDGTLKRSAATPGRAHLKTGSLRDVAAVAGYVLSNSGKRYVLVAIVNHENAAAARPAFDALVQWTIRHAAGMCCQAGRP